MQDLIVLTNDPSITAWGYVVIDSHGHIYTNGCIKTETEHKKKRIRKSDDTTRRVHEINLKLLSLIKQYKVNYIISELPHGSQNASAAVMIGVAAGIGQTLADALAIPIEWYSEQDAKKAVLNKKAATKQEMVDVITELYDVPWSGIKYIDEAVADAMAIFHVATQQSPIFQYIRKR